MPINYPDLVKNTKIELKESPQGIQVLIKTPRLKIRSVEESDISFYQDLWADKTVMEKFATGKPRLYSGSDDEKESKSNRGAEYDYALWRINGWLNKRKNDDIWHGLTVCDESDKPIGHIVLGGGELAYFIEPKAWNKGYASEAAVALIGIALPLITLKHPKYKVPPDIIATVRTDHEFSQKVLKNVGFEIDEHTKISEKYGCRRFEVNAPTTSFITRYNEQRSKLLRVESQVVFFSQNIKKTNSSTETEETELGFGLNERNKQQNQGV